MNAKAYHYHSGTYFIQGAAEKIRDFIQNGGTYFGMCLATDALDIALAAKGVDIVPQLYDYTPEDSAFQSHLKFNRTLAFENFKIVSNPYQYELSSIDANSGRSVPESKDFFELLEYNATSNPFEAMATQNHRKVMKGFMGGTTAFHDKAIKASVKRLAILSEFHETRMLSGKFGKGHFVYLGGHDPEDYRNFLGEACSQPERHPNSAAYRLVLNQIFATKNSHAAPDSNLSLYPKLVTDKTQLSFIHQELGKWNVKAIDLQGREVWKDSFDKIHKTHQMSLLFKS